MSHPTPGEYTSGDPSRAGTAHAGQYGPLGPGQAPLKDPMKGFNGMVSGALVMEAISILLALLVVLKLDGGELWTAFNAGFIAVLGLFHLVMPAFVRKPWAIPVILGAQVVGLFGFVIHWSIGAVVLIFALVWAFAMHLRSSLIARMERGLLTTQHLGTE